MRVRNLIGWPRSAAEGQSHAADTLHKGNSPVLEREELQADSYTSSDSFPARFHTERAGDSSNRVAFDQWDSIHPVPVVKSYAWPLSGSLSQFAEAFVLIELPDGAS